MNIQNKKKILIVRSVSFQQLDKNLNAVVETFPENEHLFQLLTHSHGIERARSYGVLSEIIDYDSRKNFTLFHVPGFKKVRGEEHTRYEAVVVPVTNQTGTGFLNVLAMTLRIPANSVYVCNMNSEMRRLSKIGIFSRVIKSILLSIVSGVLVLPLIILGLPFLLISIGGRSAKKRKTKSRD